MTFRRTRCPHCKGKLDQGQKLHPECIDGYAEALAAKAERAKAKAERMAARVEREETRRRKEKAMTRGERIARAQAAVNALVRARDAALPCISCGRFHDGQWHAGHYRSRGAAPHLALDMRNIHKQCQPCNTHLHGNLIGYRAGLIARFSLEYVEMLESDNVPRRLRDEEIDAIWQDAKAKLKEMK